MTSRTSLRSAVLLAATATLLGCARYRPAPLDAERPLREAPLPPGGAWTFEDAVRYAIDHNPDLAALRSHALAVNMEPPRAPVDGSIGADSDYRAELGLSVDALSLLGLGSRPYEVALARARRSEAFMAHHERARAIAGDIAEALAVVRALDGLAEPDYRVDVDVFVRAGLEAGSAKVAAQATAAAWKAEQAARVEARTLERLALLRALGLPPGSEIRWEPAPPAWPAVPEATPSALVAARADVQQRVAAFETADRALRLAVRGQYPSLILEPGLAFDPLALFGAVRLNLPTGMSGSVRAAEAAREAARAEVESAVLDALSEAGEARARWTAAGATLAAARDRVEASSALLSSSRLRLDVASGSPVETVLAADAVVDASAALRAALLEEARSRVRAARAAGWPGLPR